MPTMTPLSRPLEMSTVAAKFVGESAVTWAATVGSEATKGTLSWVVSCWSSRVLGPLLIQALVGLGELATQLLVLSDDVAVVDRAREQMTKGMRDGVHRPTKGRENDVGPTAQTRGDATAQSTGSTKRDRRWPR